MPHTGLLTVTCHRARNLEAKDLNGKSDPYCVLQLYCADKAVGKKLKTKVVDCCLDPEWEESFQFDAVAPDMELRVRAYDKDTFSKDDFLGSVALTPAEHAHPNVLVTRWYRLEKAKHGDVLISLWYHVPEDGGPFEEDCRVGRALRLERLISDCERVSFFAAPALFLAAARGGRKRILERLLAHAAPIEGAEDGRLSAVSAAIGSGSVPIVEMLVRELNMDLGGNARLVVPGRKRPVTPLLLAVEHDEVEMVEYILAQRPDLDACSGDEELGAIHAATSGDMYRALLEAGCRTDVLHNRSLAFVYAERGAVEALREHLQDVEARSADLEELLRAAAEHGQAGVVEWLLQKGVAVDAREPDTGLTALMLAGSARVVSLLLAAGAKLNATTASHCTPLHFAAERGDIGVAMALISSGADVNARLAVDGVRKVGPTPLVLAACGRHWRVVEALARMGACAHYDWRTSNTQLHEAAAADDAAQIKRLVRAGHNLCARDADGLAPLHVAARAGKKKACKALLDAGADPALPTIPPDGSKPVPAYAMCSSDAFRAMLECTRGKPAKSMSVLGIPS